jgi:hypothetical protein
MRCGPSEVDQQRSSRYAVVWDLRLFVLDEAVVGARRPDRDVVDREDLYESERQSVSKVRPTKEGQESVGD